MSRLFRAEAPPPDGLAVGALAPMVDMMTILLVFLLRTWSTDAPFVAPAGPFALAGTRSEAGRHGGVEILVARDAVWVDGERVVALDRLGEEPVVRPVYDRLLALRAPRRVEVVVDREVPWRELRKLLSTVQAAGVAEVGLVGANAGAM